MDLFGETASDKLQPQAIPQEFVPLAERDAFLPHVEKGVIVLIGATTENPSFEVISPLLSRSKVLVLNELTPADLKKIVERTLSDKKLGLGKSNLTVEKDALDFLVSLSNGDARIALNTLEIAANLVGSNSTLDLKTIKEALQKETLRYDRAGEEHYNTISAFIKSLRGSDPNAALYYLARMLEAGEDPLFIARRLVIKGEVYLPEKLQGRRYYSPSDQGFEKEIKMRMKKLDSKF